jgi:saccharopine dehydrogenase (NAD+, L-lysine-forming)
MRRIYIRSETLLNEQRTPIVPKDIRRLLSNYIIYIESSEQRIFSDKEYFGCIVTTEKWYSPFFDNNTPLLIIGLKELKDMEKLDNHSHIYFSHSFKGQSTGKEIINSFQSSGSTLYDLEYFTDIYGKRLLTFSYFAGIAGGMLGTLQYYSKKQHKNISHLTSWKSFDEMLDDMSPYLNELDVDKPNVLIIGNGLSASGVKSILKTFDISFDVVGREQTNVTYSNYDIVYNCIKLDENSTQTFFDEENTKDIVHPFLIVDISCDADKKNNPISIYDKDTTWENPVFTYPKNNNIDIIAISNLPSLLPKESSEHFSEKLTDLLLDPKNIGWLRSIGAYKRSIRKE